MSSVKGVNSGAVDPYESVRQVGNDSSIDGAKSIDANPAQTSVEQPEELREKEKKGLEQYATERIAEEQIKAQLKKTELAGELDSSQVKTDQADQSQNKDSMYIDYRDADPQPIPFHGPNGELQRWDVHDKKWK